MWLALILISSANTIGYSETRIHHPALQKEVDENRRTQAFYAIDNAGSVVFSLTGKLDRFNLKTGESKIDEALLFGVSNGRPRCLTTSQYAYVNNQSVSSRHSLHALLRADSWSRAWVAFSLSPDDGSLVGRGGCISRIDVDKRGQSPNFTLELPRATSKTPYLRGEALSLDERGRVHASIREGGRYFLKTLTISGSRLIERSESALPVGFTPLLYDPVSRRAFGYMSNENFIYHPPSKSLRRVRRLGQGRIFFARGDLYQQHDGLNIDRRKAWERISSDVVLAVSSDSNTWVIDRPGKGLLLRRY